MSTNIAHTAHTIFRGTINGVQTFSFGFWWRYKNSGPGAQLPSSDEVMDILTSNSAYTGKQDAFLVTLAGFMWNKQIFNSLDVYVYGENPATPTRGTRTLVTAGSSNSMLVPAEVAVVASLRSNSTGPSGRGRSYLPLGALQPAQDGSVPTGQAQTLASAVATYLQDSGNVVNNQGGPDQFQIIPTVVSKTHQLTHDIGAVIVDTKFDSQRRREDKLPATQEIAPVLVVA
jgi:hypothetical protein